MASRELKNTLQQDLFLLAKNHYLYSGGHELINAARVILSQHLLLPYERVQVSDVDYWLTHEFVKPGILFHNSVEQLSLFMVGLGAPKNWYVPPPGGPVSDQMLPAGQQPNDALDLFRDKHGCYEYRYTLAMALFSELRLTRVRENSTAGVLGTWTMPFPECFPDPAIMALIEAGVKGHVQ